MKRIITAGLIVFLFSYNAFAIDDDTYTDSIITQLYNGEVEIRKIMYNLNELAIAIYPDYPDDIDVITDIIHNAEFYANFCGYEGKVLALYLDIEKKRKKNVSSWLYEDMLLSKIGFEQHKKIFWRRYSELKNKSALHLADKIKIKIDEIEGLIEKLLNIYRPK